jgi:hypothetical protein
VLFKKCMEEELEQKQGQEEKQEEQRRNQKKTLPTAKNRAAKFASRVNAQCLYYAVFTMIPCHIIPEDFHALTTNFKDILTSLSNKCTPTLTPKDKMNFEVASWIPSCNAMTSLSSCYWRTMSTKTDFPPSQPTKSIL